MCRADDRTTSLSDAQMHAVARYKCFSTGELRANCFIARENLNASHAGVHNDEWCIDLRLSSANELHFAPPTVAANHPVDVANVGANGVAHDELFAGEDERDSLARNRSAHAGALKGERVAVKDRDASLNARKSRKLTSRWDIRDRQPPRPIIARCARVAHCARIACDDECACESVLPLNAH